MAFGKHTLAPEEDSGPKPTQGPECSRTSANAQYNQLRKVVLAGTIIVLAVAAVLVTALSMGWNSPRPTGEPDWRSSSLPITLDVSADGSALQLADWSASDFSLEVETGSYNTKDISEAGLVYGAQDANHYTVFAVGNDGYYAVLRVNGTDIEALIPWQRFPHVHRAEQSNRLRVNCCGIICKFFINDEYATSIEDHTRRLGQIGLWASGTSSNTTVLFTEMQVWQGCR